MSQYELPQVSSFPPEPMAFHGLVVLSGGQDSVTCLGVAKKCYLTVSAVCFDYGQKHAVELESARLVCEKHNVPLTIIKVDALKDIADSALFMNSTGSVNDGHSRISNLPASFVPNRNAMFLTIAHALAQKIGAKYLVTGVSQTDYSGYPDCRSGFIHKLQEALNAGSEATIKIITPLINKNKAETFLLSERAGVLEDVINISHTCYNGDHETFHDWGYGCGECPACQLRAKGWEEYKSLLGEEK